MLDSGFDMNLALLLFDYFPYGGLERGCFMLAEECARRGHAVRIFTTAWRGPAPKGASVVTFGRPGWSNVSVRRNYLRRWQLEYERERKRLDVVLGFNKLPGLDFYYGSDACYLAHVRRLKPFWYPWTSRYRHFQSWENAVFQRGSRTRILMLTEKEIPVYQELYGTEPERFHVLPPGLVRRSETAADRARIRGEVRREFGWPEGTLLMLLVGSGFRTKGLDRAIRGLAALSPAVRDRTRLVVVGDDRPGPFRWLARLLGVSGRVEFLGGRPNVYDFLTAADLLVHPAHAENTGNVLLEAMTAGLPVVASGVCGYAGHVTTAGAGKIVGTLDAFSQSEFNRVVETMLTSPERAVWGQNALRYAAVADLYSRRQVAVDILENVGSSPSRYGSRSARPG